jgi:thiamine biosynthesis lipoprotein
MKESRMLMGMPITVEIVDSGTVQSDIDSVFGYFAHVDAVFSTYKDESEISRINRGELQLDNASSDMQIVFKLSEQTKHQTNGYFDIWNGKHYDPSGLVKGWAIHQAAEQLRQRGFNNFCLEAGGDMETNGFNEKKEPWRIGIRNPLETDQIIKVVRLTNHGIATSGTYLRGQHIYNPLRPNEALQKIVSLTVIGPNVYDADRFATAAFAMGEAGIMFIEKLHGFEGYQIDQFGLATLTSGFDEYLYE